MLANGLEWFAVWFAKLGNGLAELTNQLVTLAIFIMGFVIWFAVLANWLALTSQTGL